MPRPHATARRTADVEIAARVGVLRPAEIVAAFRRFGTDPSNCFALAWGEAVAFKPV